MRRLSVCCLDTQHENATGPLINTCFFHVSFLFSVCPFFLPFFPFFFRFTFYIFLFPLFLLPFFLASFLFLFSCFFSCFMFSFFLPFFGCKKNETIVETKCQKKRFFLCENSNLGLGGQGLRMTHRRVTTFFIFSVLSLSNIFHC